MPARLRIPLDGLRLDVLMVTEPIEVDVRLDGILEGVAVCGTLGTAAEGVCARCAAPVSIPVNADVDELYTYDADADGETYELDDEMIDLEPMLRDAILLALPLHPLCRPDCAGLCPVCGEDRNRVTCGCDMTMIDPRWGALEALRDEMEE